MGIGSKPKVRMTLIFKVDGEASSDLSLDIKNAPLKLVRAYELGLIELQKRIIEAQG